MNFFPYYSAIYTDLRKTAIYAVFLIKIKVYFNIPLFLLKIKIKRNRSSQLIYLKLNLIIKGILFSKLFHK